MRPLFSIVGNLLVVVGLGGLVLLAPGPTDRSLPEAAEGLTAAASALGGQALVSGGALVRGALAAPGPAAAEPAVAVTPPSTAWLPITRVVIPRISLDTDVVPARFVERQDGARTWEVPAFKAGHAEHTAGAGQLGNAVLLGHVTSRQAGNVFKDLEHVQPGDVVHVFTGTDRFDYRVVDVRTVPRTDVSVVAATETTSVSLITCAGRWLPAIWDYTDRLAIRAQFIAPSAP